MTYTAARWSERAGVMQPASASAVVEIGGEVIAGEYEGDASPIAAKRAAVEELISKLRERGLAGVLRIV